MHENVKNLCGLRFNKLTVIEYSGKRGCALTWLCKCDCGNLTIVQGGNLKNGHTKSCGCYKLQKVVTHGQRYKTIYGRWNSMLQRTTNPNNMNFKHYGGRGVKVCEEWFKFENFFEWAKYSGFEEGKTIDRIDVNGNYEPSNCRWVDMKTQARNRRGNLIIDYRGEKKSLAQWCEDLNIGYKKTYKRLSMKWSVERAFTEK